MPDEFPAVTDPDASRLNAGFSDGQRLERRVRARVLVGVEARAHHRSLDRDDLVGEAAGGMRIGPAPLGGERERVLLVSRDAAALDDVLGGLAHRVRVVGIGQARVREAPAEGRVEGGLLAAREGGRWLGHHERRAGHRLDAAGDEHRTVAKGHGMRGSDDRLEPGAAEPVDGLAGDLDRQPGEERGHPADVAVVLPGLVGGAEDDVVDHRVVDAGAVDERRDHVRREVIGPDVLQGAAVSSKRRSEAVDDDGGAGRIARHRHRC